MDIFEGLKVIDLTKVFSGPLATRMLADYGAEVIKVEYNDKHDDSRYFPPIKNGWSGYFEILNRNKKNIELDLTKKIDLEKFYKLCEEADVIVENLSPTAKFKLKVDYETIKKINAKIVYASLSGLGQKSNKKYYDVIAQAESGLMSLSGEGDQPFKIGPSVVDAFSGMTLAFAISAALYYRERTGKGQFIDVAMLGCAMNLLESSLTQYSLTGADPKPVGNKDTVIAPFGVYKTGDGYVVIAVGNNVLWEKLVGWLQEQGEKIDKDFFDTNSLRIEHQKELTQCLEKVFANWDAGKLVAKLEELDIPCALVAKMSDVCGSKRNVEQGFVRIIDHSRLGTCVVPGQSIIFSEQAKINYKESVDVGHDNDEYRI